MELDIVRSTADMADLIHRIVECRLEVAGDAEDNHVVAICDQLSTALLNVHDAEYGIVRIYDYEGQLDVQSDSCASVADARAAAAKFKRESSTTDPRRFRGIAVVLIDNTPSVAGFFATHLDEIRDAALGVSESNQAAALVSAIATGLRRACTNGSRYAIIGWRHQSSSLSSTIEVKPLCADNDDQRDRLISELRRDGYKSRAFDAISLESAANTG